MSQRLVPSDVILQGAWYALEQAGCLLVAAETIARNGDVTTAAGIALLGREEYAKARLLIDLSHQAGESGGVPASTLTFDDHQQKQKAGNPTTVIKTQNLGLARLAREDPEASRQTLDVMTEAKRKRTPDRRHELRVECLYVDFDEDRWAWSRPSEIRPEEVGLELQHAISDYNLFVERLTILIEHPEHREMFGGPAAILATFADGWPDRPSLPKPRLPDDF